MSELCNKDAINYSEGKIKKKGFCKSIRTDDIYRKKCLLTLCCGWAYGMYGWQVAQIGIALPELQQILNVGLDTIAWIYTCFYVGMIFSGFLFGFLYDRFNRLTVITICVVCVGILHGIVPLSTSFPVTLVLRLFIGVFVGGIETGMVTIVSTIWGSEEASFIYASYLSFCIGGFIGPVVTTPFMSNGFQEARHTIEEQLNKDNLTQSDLNNTSSIIKHVSVTPLSPLNITDGDSRIYLAFVITGVVTVIASVPFIYMIKSNTYHNIRLILDSLRTKQHLNITIHQTDFDEQRVSGLKYESTKYKDVEAIKKTIEPTHDIMDAYKVSDRAVDDFDIRGELPKARGKVIENFDLSCVEKEVPLKNRNEQINLAFVEEQQNEFKENNDSTIERSAITDQDSKYLSSTFDNCLREGPNTKHDQSNYKNLKLRSSMEDSNKRIPNINQENSKNNNLKTSTTTDVIPHGNYKICIIFCIDMISLFIYAGDDEIFNFLPTFCFEYLNWTIISSATLLSVFNMAAVFGGIISIFLSKILSPTTLMLTALVGYNISTISGFVASACRLDWLIWLSVSISGCFIVMIPPTSTRWIQQNVCPISGKISASLTLAGGIGMASTPNIIGYTMQTITHMYYWYTLIGFAVLGCFAFILAFTIQRFRLSIVTRF